MLNELKEIKEKLNQLILEVERLENEIHGEEIIIETKDFKYLKKIGATDSSHVFEYLEGVIFTLPASSRTSPYKFSIFEKLYNKELDRIILLKRDTPFRGKNGYTITHNIEDEVGTKMRENYRE
ncbi:hypothetical protein [Algoriphagus persicinus]|uniref:hypothetical protein n=1 Tax=Algoriphagus persicinus TaxID=3108754 RepID=UPI002B38729B|nr:hypothetical protein [Algoriphagus sp. E1-3-M2]MEB2786504.1 hypothetical protein [Algoriphagus sp. E1-3-M2]